MTGPGLTPDEERELRTRIAALPDSIEPARDLWPAIQARVDAARVHPMVPPDRVDGLPSTVVMYASRRLWPGLAAAAALLITASVSLTWLAMRQGNNTPEMAYEAAVDLPPEAGALASFASYERSAADLASTLEQRTARLDSATRAVLERSLRTIDEALAEARSALAADPSSAAFHSFVEAAYRQKLDFLRRANDVATMQGA